jgi:hypothetical protein
MTIEFGDGIKGNRRGEVQTFIEQKVDRDTDVYLAAVSQNPVNNDYMRVYWHRSPADQELHLTGDVRIVSFLRRPITQDSSVSQNNDTIGTAHIYQNGQVTMYTPNED